MMYNQESHKNRPKIRITIPSKNLSLAIVLTVIFGPFGLIYVSILSAIAMLLITIFCGFVFLGNGFLYTWPLCIVLSYFAVKRHNSKIIEEKL